MLAVHRGEGNAARIVFCNDAARRAGVRPGITLAAARSRASDLRTVAFDARRAAEVERDAVTRLLAVSPRIAGAGPGRFWVEPAPGRGARIERWCEDATAALSAYGRIAVGVGPFAAVAWAAARSLGHGHRIVPPAAARAFLDDAPLEAIELEGEARDVLRALGVRTVHDLRALDPVSLGMRFGPAVADARRRADGVDPRRPSTPRPTAPDEVVLSLDGEVDSLEPLLFLLGPATERLAATLRRNGRGALRTRLELTLDGGARHTIDAVTGAPLADGRTMLEVLRARLEGPNAEPLPRAITGLRVVAVESGPLREPPPTLPALGERPGRDPAAREAVLARLRSRLGDHAVRRAARAETGHPLARARWSGEPEPGEAHPWRRLDPPVPVVGGRVRLDGRLRVVRRVGRVERAAGPWWSDGHRRVELLAWAELDGPMLVLLRGRCSSNCDDVWEVVAWID